MTPKPIPGVPAPPENRGALLSPRDVAALIGMSDPDSRDAQRWVREHVPNKKRISHKMVRWYERDVHAWIESRGAA